MFPLIIALLAILYTVAVLAYYAEINKYKGINKIPGDRVLPLIGNALSMRFSIVGEYNITINNNINKCQSNNQNV